MTCVSAARRGLAAMIALTALTATAGAQEAGLRIGGPGRQGAPDLRSVEILGQNIERLYFNAVRMAPVVKDAPYAGEGVTTTTQVLSDGTRIERTNRTRIWRDRMGRVRREQTTVGLGALSPANDAATTITIEDPVAGMNYTLDPNTRTARSTRLTAGGQVSVGSIRAGAESLGTREMEGVKVTGSRTTVTIPAGQIGNDRPLVTTAERWESPELQVLIYSLQSDPRTGTVEYRLSGISRADQPLDLFTVPPGYSVATPPALTVPGLGAATPAGRGGGAGGRGGRSNSVDSLIPAIPNP